MIVLHSAIRANKKYYLQTLLEECKYEIKKNKMDNLINDDLDLSSSDESDNEESNESNYDLMVKNLMINLLMINLVINLMANLKIKTVL